MFGRFHEWPLRPGVLLSMPIMLMIERREGPGLPASACPASRSKPTSSTSTAGRCTTSSSSPTRGSSCSIRPSELHRDWARAGVNRAVIDKRAQADNLWSLLKTHADAQAGRNHVPLPAARRRTLLRAAGRRHRAPAGGACCSATAVTRRSRRRPAALSRRDRWPASASRARTSSGPAPITDTELHSRAHGRRPRVPVDDLLQLRDRQAAASSTISGPTTAATRSSRA